MFKELDSRDSIVIFWTEKKHVQMYKWIGYSMPDKLYANDMNH